MVKSMPVWIILLSSQRSSDVILLYHTPLLRHYFCYALTTEDSSWGCDYKAPVDLSMRQYMYMSNKQGRKSKAQLLTDKIAGRLVP